MLLFFCCFYLHFLYVLLQKQKALGLKTSPQEVAAKITQQIPSVDVFEKVQHYFYLSDFLKKWSRHTVFIVA